MQADSEMDAQQQELLRSREQYYDHTNSIEAAEIYCGDERPPVPNSMSADSHQEAASNSLAQPSDEMPFVHMFGGGLFVAYNGMVLKLVQNDNVPTFADAAAATVEQLVAQGITGVGVHSDTHAEHDVVLHTDHTEGVVGCGYAQKRAAISQLIHDTGDEILDDMKQLRPDLFSDPANTDFAHSVIAAHGLLAQDTQRLGNGRAVVLAAVKAKARTMLVDGDHIAKHGIVNGDNNSSFNSGRAYADGNATYDHDIWASTLLLRDLNPEASDAHIEIASMIDIIGTMRALGVTTIAYRSEGAAV